MKRALLVLGGSLVYCLAMGVLLAPIALALLLTLVWFIHLAIPQ